MIPSVVASEVTGALRDFLATGFGPSNPALANVGDDFLAEPGNLAKEPYLSIALPFQPAPEGGEPFPEIPDVLLTNYKMLDYLLVRPFDFRRRRSLRRDNGSERPRMRLRGAGRARGRLRERWCRLP